MHAHIHMHTYMHTHAMRFLRPSRQLAPTHHSPVTQLSWGFSFLSNSSLFQGISSHPGSTDMASKTGESRAVTFAYLGWFPLGGAGLGSNGSGMGHFYSQCVWSCSPLEARETHRASGLVLQTSHSRTAPPPRAHSAPWVRTQDSTLDKCSAGCMS